MAGRAEDSAPCPGYLQGEREIMRLAAPGMSLKAAKALAAAERIARAAAMYRCYNCFSSENFCKNFREITHLYRTHLHEHKISPVLRFLPVSGSSDREQA